MDYICNATSKCINTSCHHHTKHGYEIANYNCRNSYCNTVGCAVECVPYNEDVVMEQMEIELVDIDHVMDTLNKKLEDVQKELADLIKKREIVINALNAYKLYFNTRKS